MKRRDFLFSSAATATFGITLPLGARAGERPSPPSLSAFAQLPKIKDISLSQDGKRVAFATRVEASEVIVDYDLSTQTQNVIRLPESKDKYQLRSLAYIGPNHLLQQFTIPTKMSVFAGDSVTLKISIIIDTKDNKVVKFKGDANPVESFTDFGNSQTYVRDGKYYYSTTNYENALGFGGAYYSYLVLNEYDVSAGKWHQLDATEWGDTSWVQNAQGEPIARSIFDEKKDPNNKTWRLEFKEQNTWKKVYEIVENIDTPDLIGLSSDGTGVVVRFYTGALENQYVVINPKGEVSAPIEGGASASYALFHPETKRHVGFGYSGDWVGYEYFDPKLKNIEKTIAASLEGSRYKIYDTARDPRKTIIYSEGVGDSGTYNFIDFGTGEVINIGVNYPDVPTEWIVEKKPIGYEAADGLEIHGYLTLPQGREGKSLPLIVLPHGGPRARDNLAFDWEAQTYASRGYAVLQPNFRGSTGYGEDFTDAGNGQWGRKMQTDLSDGVRYLASQGIIDPRRVAICGASYGGYAALAGAAFDQDVYRCAVAVAGLSDLDAFTAEIIDRAADDKKSSSVRAWQRMIGSGNLAEISPAMNAHKIKCPVLLIHGKNDTVVPIDQSRRMHRAMKAAGKDVTFIEFDKEDHWQSLGPARLDMIEAIMAFLEKHNPAYI